MVVIDFPETIRTGTEHDRIGCASKCTVHAPHAAMPQPNLLPVSPRVSRSTHRSGISGSTSTLATRPFTIKEIAMAPSLVEGASLHFKGNEKTPSRSIHQYTRSINPCGSLSQRCDYAARHSPLQCGSSV